MCHTLIGPERGNSIVSIVSIRPHKHKYQADVRERSDACVLFGFFASAFILRSELSLTSGTEISNYCAWHPNKSHMVTSHGLSPAITTAGMSPKFRF
jgi:hypothetical protein